jgi:hypothetical protein
VNLEGARRRQVVERQRRVMGHDGAPPGRLQSGGHDVLVRVSRHAREPVVAPADPFEMARIGVMDEAPTAVADRTCLRGSDVAVMMSQLMYAQCI